VTTSADFWTKLGRYQVVEDPGLNRLHFHLGGALKKVDHEPKADVLDQEDLLAQGIDTATLVPGAAKVDALGSCTANATTVALSNLGDAAFFAQATAKLLGGGGVTSYANTKSAEEFAILFYHNCTDQTGDPNTEYPPTDCGSSGPYVVEYAKSLGLIAGDTVAHGAQNIVSLMQTDGLIVGQPWLTAWMEPNAQGFIDGDGSMDNLDAQISQGVAGGHETYWSAIEKLVVTRAGRVDPTKTVIRFRNSWTKNWGDNGSGRVHLSTFMALGQYCDFRQLQPTA